MLAEKLKESLQYSQNNLDFPDFLAREIEIIMKEPEIMESKNNLIESLIFQVSDYDPYAEAGCCKDATSPEDIKKTINSILYK
ncbi:MAG TPA: hypothetical protein DHM44_11080 [Flexistipes sinusarabici]|uniref:Uncharacterized protein n=1 Tax=Flexistipes sinusarabici TaxID=2352 RepID=A0A3D5QEY9_FLESI|nr:hypothetical protein [Flexistipes sinusarabici]